MVLTASGCYWFPESGYCAGSSKRLREAQVKGHLRQRGNAWELRAYAGIDPLTNRQKYVTRTFHGGKREAEEALARLVVEVCGGGHTAQDTTVGDLLRQWLELTKAELSPTTARGYEWIIRTYILPTLGSTRLARLKSSQLDRFYAKLRDQGGQDASRCPPRPSDRFMRFCAEPSIRPCAGSGFRLTLQRMRHHRESGTNPSTRLTQTA
jgi:hypothetical protein